MTDKLANSQSLKQKLPEYFYDNSIPHAHRKRCAFIERLADFARDFHATGKRHGNFDLAHIFLNDDGDFFVTDLQSAFTPGLFAGRYLVKDIAQLHYSAPGQHISCTDRLRFFQHYIRRKKLTTKDRIFVKQVKSKAWRMAHSSIKQGKEVPFAS